MVEAIQAETCARRTPLRGYGQPMEQVLLALQTPWVQAQLDRTPWKRVMYRECTHTPRPQVVSVSVEWWLRTSEVPSGLTTSGESKSPTTMATPPTWMTSSWNWEDSTEEVVGEMWGAPRDKWVCRKFPHRLAQDLKEELRDQIREGLIQTEQACLQWLAEEERVDAPNQKLEDLWSIPLPLERGELRVRE